MDVCRCVTLTTLLGLKNMSGRGWFVGVVQLGKRLVDPLWLETREPGTTIFSQDSREHHGMLPVGIHSVFRQNAMILACWCMTVPLKIIIWLTFGWHFGCPAARLRSNTSDPSKWLGCTWSWVFGGNLPWRRPVIYNKNMSDEERLARRQAVARVQSVVKFVRTRTKWGRVSPCWMKNIWHS